MDLKYLSNRGKEGMLQQTQERQDKLHLGKIMQNLKFGKLQLSFGTISDLAEDNLRMNGDLNSGRINKGLATGFFRLDRMTSGLQKSDLVVISGGTSTGKTTMAYNSVIFAAKKNQKPIVYFSLETPKNELLLRILSSEAKVALGQISRGFLCAENWTKLREATDKISRMPLYIVDEPAISITTLETKARLMKEKTDLGLIVVENIHLMRAEGFRSTRDREISEITHSLKTLAMELKVPVIAVSQINRKADNRAFYPAMSDLRDSSAIEQNADMILFLCPVNSRKIMVVRYDEKIVEINIVKHRKGRTGSFQLAFLERFTKFEKLTNVDEPTQTRKEQTTLGAKEAIFCSDTHAVDEHTRRQPMSWDNALSTGKNPARMGVYK